MSETSLSALVKEIGEALLLDDNNHDKAAYKKYVSCIYKIATNLILAMRLAGGDVLVDSKTSKQVKLVHQCVERVIALLDKMDSSNLKPIDTTVLLPSTVITMTPDKSVVIQHSIEMDLKPDFQISPTVSRTLQISSKAFNRHSVGFIPSEPSLVLEKNPYSYSISRSHALTPMEIARKQNQSLMTAYKARMERLNRSDFNAFNYSLTMQRKMAENIAIAHAQEEELARKMQARNLRLEEEAAKRFATPIGMSKEEQEQRQIYKKILEYENEAKWLKNWRSRLESNPEDPILISRLVQEILRCSDHPFTELLHKYQFHIYQRLYPLVANKHEEIDFVKVPLPFCVWPSMDAVAEVFSDNIHSLIFPESVSLNRDKDKYRISMRSKDSTEKRDDFKVSEDNATVETREHGPETDFAECESVSFDTQEVSKTGAALQSAVDDKREPELEATQSENIDARSRKETIFQGDGHDRVVEQLNYAIDGQRHHRSDNKISYTSEDIPAQISSIDPLNISQHKTFDCDNINERHDGAYVPVNTSTKTDTRLIVDTDKILESQISWERRQAQLLMRQVTKDNNGCRLGDSDYDENNLDYLFDDDDDDDDDGDGDDCGWLTDNDLLKTTYPQDCITSSELILQGQGPNVDRSTSHTPAAPRDLNQTDDVPTFQSLPTNLGVGNKNYQDKQFDKLSQEAYQRHLTSISDDIHCYLEKLLVMLTIAYEPLDTPIGKDQCAVSLEEPFFKPIWKTLLRLFRVVNHKQELVLACVMTKFADATLEEFKVSRKLWLMDSVVKPYQSAVSELMNVREHYTMLSKLECIERSLHKNVQYGTVAPPEVFSLQNHIIFQKNRERALTFPALQNVSHLGRGFVAKIGLYSHLLTQQHRGADDLLPILTYVVVQSATPQLSSECHAMTEFIHEGYMMGEEGYCLTSLRTALNYVISMFPSVTELGQVHKTSVSQDSGESRHQ